MVEINDPNEAESKMRTYEESGEEGVPQEGDCAKRCEDDDGKRGYLE